VANKISVVIEATADKAVASLKNFRSSIAEADGATNKMKAGFAGASSAIQANAGALAATAGGALLVLGKHVLNAGVQFDSMDRKAETVFGPAGIGRVEKWADASAGAMGLTSREAKSAAASVADLLVPMGFARDEAIDMSTELVDLSGALSAWSGGTRSASEVSDILTKAMLGERDALKSLGISITEADVQRKLAEKGQTKLTGAVLEQAKALATQELIFAKSADAQAAWSNGSMNSTKRSNEMQAAIDRLNEVLVEGLFPVVIQLTPAITSMAESLGELGEAAEKLHLDELVSFAAKMPTALTVAADAVESLGDAWSWAFGDDNQDAAKDSGDAAEYYGSRVAAAKAETEALEAAQLDAAQATEDAKVEVERYARAQKFASDEVQRRLDLERELYGDQRDAIERQREYNRSIADLAVVLGDSKAGLDSQFDSALKASEAFATLNGATLESKEGTNRQVQSLHELTASLAPDSPLRAALQQYVQQLAAIPASVDTALRLNISQGATTTKDGDFIGRRPGVRGATGGIVNRPTVALIGEAGPEAVIPLNRTAGNSPLPGGLGGSTTVNIYTNADPNSTKAALRLFNRRNGPGL
jgi:hypothetical protein